ncbi:MvdC/MvdD family ATP grasp protein, partial [Streptomyces sp. NPDC005921]
MTVLILTSDEDVTADMVVLRLHEAGVPVVRLDPADLTSGVALSGEYVQGASRGHLSVNGRLVSVNGLRSIWVSLRFQLANVLRSQGLYADARELN